MPDWFYRTVSKPILFRLPAPRARNLALGFMGGLARLPFGLYLIDFLGHMRADTRLRQSFLDIDFPTAVGIGPWLDTQAVALRALARFGIGFIEVGPVTLERNEAARPIRRLDDQEAFWVDTNPESISLADFNRRLRDASDLGSVAVMAWLESETLIAKLDPSVCLVSLPTLAKALELDWSIEQWSTHVRKMLAQAVTPSRSLLLRIAADAGLSRITPLLDVALREGIAGVVVDGTMQAEPDGRIVGLPVRELAHQQVQEFRQRWPNMFIIASGGVHEPEHALELRSAGADLIQVDTGLVYTGPGLPKRINDCLLFESVHRNAPEEKPDRVPELSWFCTTLMGAGMLIGGFLALTIAATNVVLPYDEAYLGMSRDQIAAVNPHLLDFMAHDRISLAGCMIAIGLVYMGLSLFGTRYGLHWARQSVLISAFTGFASFFLFLGFGYLDPFHAFVTAALLQMLLLGVHARLGMYTPTAPLDARGDRAWQLSLWGQLLLVVHGFALLGAGAVISTIGVTHVFVPEDLEFMRTTADVLSAANPRLVPLVAHDRATLGGMLLASGWIFLLPALWGYRSGSAWLWWTLLCAGSIAYAAALAVHYVVGYHSVKHLLPAIGGFVLLMVGLILSYPFLCRKKVSRT